MVTLLLKSEVTIQPIGQSAVDGFIREFDMENLFGFKAGTRFTAP